MSPAWIHWRRQRVLLKYPAIFAHETSLIKKLDLYYENI